MTALLFLLISFFASLAGAVCGIGGGIIIKPVLDLFRLADITTINFLSGCTVLAMSSYSVLNTVIRRANVIRLKTGTPLAFGSVLGGIAGKMFFSAFVDRYGASETTVKAQAACVGVMVLITLAYLLLKNKIKTYHVTSPFACVGLGVALGSLSSFLGIGGGPFNLVILFYFFSMDEKTAAQNSLYMIAFSQLSSLAATVLTGSAPRLEIVTLTLMMLGGVLGAAAGGVINRGTGPKTTRRMMVALMVLLEAICVVNLLL
jgi:uncharacterized membrane protein YfcA